MVRQSADRPLLLNGEGLRRTDVERPSGGGGAAFVPFDERETRQLLQPAARDLRAAANALLPAQRVTRIVFEATLYPNFLAASSLPVDLFSFLDVDRIGSRYGKAVHRTRTNETTDVDTKTLILTGDDAAIGRLEELLTVPRGREARSIVRAREGLQRLSNLRLPSAANAIPAQPTEPLPDLTTDRSEYWAWEAILHPDPLSRGRAIPASAEVIEHWIAYVRSLGGDVARDWIRTAGSLTTMPVRLPEGTAREVAVFNPLRTLRPMPQLRSYRALEYTGPTLEVNVPLPASATAPSLRVAVFDGGVNDNSPYFDSRVTSIEVTGDPPHAGAEGHGTLVTSAILYGHVTGPLEPAPVHVDHYRVLPDSARPGGPELYWLLDVIEQCVTDGDYDVVNLSLGPKINVLDDDVDPWTARLDELSYRKDVLFVIAAGNNGEQDAATGLNRVEVPADMINGLGVGSCSSLRPPIMRASYSAVGPGRSGGRVKPNGVSFGGAGTELFTGVDGSGALIEDWGTSFAAPFTVHGLADLHGSLGGGALPPEVLRAFAIHFTVRGGAIREVGFGGFRGTYDDVLECPANEVRVLYQGAVARDEYLALDLPLPDTVSESIAPIQMHYTLVTSSPVDAADAVEYARACLEPTLRPNSRIRRFTPPSGTGGKSVSLDVHAEVGEMLRLLGEGWVMSTEPVSMSKSTSAEVTLRAEGKWDTVRTFRHKFMKPGTLHRPRIDLTHISREAGALTRGTESLNYALLVSFAAPQGVDLYAEARRTFAVLRPAVSVTSRTTVAVPPHHP